MKLPESIESKVCNCLGRFNNSGWSKDVSTGYWVHKHHTLNGKEEPCGKPSRFCSVFECDGCDEYFFAPRPPGNSLDILCPTCKELYD